MRPSSLPLCAIVSLATALPVAAQTPKLPLVNDPDLKIEQVATVPEIEAPTTVAVATDGSIYVGCDPRDTRLNTASPECTIVRFSGLGADRKRTVFADKLYSPAGSYWFRGSLYVIHDPYLTRFRDTNGDGIADEREDLVTGLGLPPYDGLNDHVVSGFTLGMDGFFYISVGDRGVLLAKGKDGSTASLHGGGILRVRPDGTQLEVYSTGTRNHLMVDLDAQDRPFTRDNTDDGNGWWTRVTHHIEGGYYGYPYDYQHPSEEWLPAMADFGGGSPTGGLVYMSDGLPEAYRNQPLFSEWGKSTVFRTTLEPRGATFRLKEDFAVATSDGKQVDFRPMELAVGADGSLFVADWGWGGWKAAKVLGNVWRLSWPGAKPAPRIADDAPLDQLINALAHVDRGQRLRAEFSLIAKGAPVVPALAQVLADSSKPAVQRWHALWAIDQIAVPESIGIIRDRLKDAEASVRSQAARALGLRRIGVATGDILPLLKDANPEVRLQAVIALGRINQGQGWQARGPAMGLAELFSDGDRWIRFATRTALKRIGDWSTVQKSLASKDPSVREQAWLTLSRSFDKGAVDVLVSEAAGKETENRKRAASILTGLLYEAKPWDGHWWGTQPVKAKPPAKTVAWEGTAASASALLAALNDSDESVRLTAATGLSQTQGPELLPALRQRLIDEKAPEVRRALVEAIGVQKDPESAAALVALAGDDSASEALRRAAISAIGNLGGDAAKQTIAGLVGKDFSTPTMIEVITAAGALKVTEAAPSLSSRTLSPEVQIRIAAVKALGQLGGKVDVYKPLVNALTDVDKKVQTEAVDAIGALKLKAAVPQLVAVVDSTKDENLRRRALAALSDMPDPQALPVLAKNLLDSQQRVRREVARALSKFGADAIPLIEERIANLPPEVASQVRAFFTTGVVSKWKMIGPFENVWAAEHEAERDVLASGAKTPDLSRKYTAADGKPTGWRDVPADGETGRVDLAKTFNTNGLAAAYAWTEIDAPQAVSAKLLCGSDDQLAVWLNGHKVYDQSAARGYQPEKDEVALPLEQGKNQLLIKVGNIGGSWEFAARVPQLVGGKYLVSKEPAPDEKQRAYALATNPDGSWLHAGDAARGAKLFHEQAGAIGGICATCHQVAGKGGQIGPDLSAVGVNYKRPDFITSIHEPSKTIALGFEQQVVETKAGETFVGALRNENADGFSVVGADGNPHPVRKADIKSQQAVPTSLMPPGLTLGLKPEEFVDLLAYLESLKGK